MLRTNSPYSSFFMSGFSYNEEEEFEPDFRRRGSLPTDALSATAPLRRQRKPDQDRSFLSLDLAESASAYTFPSGPALRSQLSLASIRSMNRTVPSPKPVPSSSLPSLPTSSSSSIPSVKEPCSPTPSSTLIPPTTLNIVAPKPISANHRSDSTRTSSTVSTRYRHTKRSDALARLEGRGAKRNFMSMSDDEEEDESFLDIAHDFSPRRTSISNKWKSGFFGFGDDHGHKHSHSSPFPANVFIEKPPIVDVPTSAISPTESRLSFLSPSSSPSKSKSGRRRSRTLIFPLTSFIDLTTKTVDHDEKRDSGRWRSFIEIAGL